jgi:hypothetical protein
MCGVHQLRRIQHSPRHVNPSINFANEGMMGDVDGYGRSITSVCPTPGDSRNGRIFVVKKLKTK